MGTETLQLAENLINLELMNCLGIETSTALARLPALHEAPATRCGIETALIDLMAQRAGLPVAILLNPNAQNYVSVNAVLGAVDDRLASKTRQALEEGFSLIKIKLGVKSIAVELQALNTLAKILPEGAMLRLDVNGCWDLNQASEALSALRKLPVESLEEPLHSPQTESLKTLQTLVPWPLALDESLRGWPIKSLLTQKPVRRLVLKPMLIGGLLPTYQLARRAQRIGIESVVTTTVDSAAGVWAALHLASALDNGFTHGLNTGTWLSEDIGDGPRLSSAKMTINDTPGLGFTPYPESCNFSALRNLY
jgi:o-succinylbenzoate synthase